MDSEHPAPFAKSMGAFRNEELGHDIDISPADAHIPWIDNHTHAHTLSWDDRHKFDLGGGFAVVCIASTAHYAPYRPMGPEEVRRQWDDTIRQAHIIDRSHLFEPYVATGIHTLVKKPNWEELIDVLPEYAALDEVVAIGETGIDHIQYGEPWPLEGQKAVIEAQMEVARDAALPVLCHTPSISKGEGKWSLPKTEEGGDLAEPIFESENPKLTAVEIDLELKDSAGLADEQLVFNHGHPSIAEFVLESTDCYLSVSTGQWIRSTDSEDIAEIIETYGPDKVMVDTDTAGLVQTDKFAMRRTIIELIQRGIPAEDVRKVVYENPREVLGLTHLPE